MLKSSLFVAAVLLALCFFIHPALAGDDEIWMSSAIRERSEERRVGKEGSEPGR